MSEYEYTEGGRVQTLEEQLTFCELSGHAIKARFLRGSIRAIKICKDQEAKDLERFKTKQNKQEN